jgi:hypothetical protein
MKLRLYLESAPDQNDGTKGPAPQLDSLTGQSYLETNDYLDHIPTMLTDAGLKVTRARLTIEQAAGADSPADGPYRESGRLYAFVLNEVGPVDGILAGDIQTITVSLLAEGDHSLDDLRPLYVYLGRIVRHEVNPLIELSRHPAGPSARTPSAPSPEPLSEAERIELSDLIAENYAMRTDAWTPEGTIQFWKNHRRMGEIVGLYLAE